MDSSNRKRWEIPFCINGLNIRPVCHTLSTAFETSQKTIQEDKLLSKVWHILGTKCLSIETPLSGAIRNQIDTCIRDFFYEKSIHIFKNNPLL